MTLTQADHIAALTDRRQPWTWPDYPVEALPVIPDGFAYEPGVLYPVFEAPELGLGVIVEYPDPAKREEPDEPRFTLYTIGDDGAFRSDIISSDNWNAILAHIDKAGAR